MTWIKTKILKHLKFTNGKGVTIHRNYKANRGMKDEIKRLTQEIFEISEMLEEDGELTNSEATEIASITDRINEIVK